MKIANPSSCACNTKCSEIPSWMKVRKRIFSNPFSCSKFLRYLIVLAKEVVTVEKLPAENGIFEAYSGRVPRRASEEVSGLLPERHLNSRKHFVRAAGRRLYKTSGSAAASATGADLPIHTTGVERRRGPFRRKDGRSPSDFGRRRGGSRSAREVPKRCEGRQRNRARLCSRMDF